MNFDIKVLKMYDNPLPPFRAYETLLSKPLKQKMREQQSSRQNKPTASVLIAMAQSRNNFIVGREQIVAFLTAPVAKKNWFSLDQSGGLAQADKELPCDLFTKWHDIKGNCFRSHGNENWHLMKRF